MYVCACVRVCMCVCADITYSLSLTHTHTHIHTHTHTHTHRWELTGEAIIVLRVDSEEQMRELLTTAGEKGLGTHMVHDAGRTQVQAGFFFTKTHAHLYIYMYIYRVQCDERLQVKAGGGEYLLYT